MKESVILLTGAYRLNNLTYIAKTINDQYNKYDLDIHWLICKDQYNSFGDINNVIDYLSNTNIKYCIIDTGKPGQPNYGGDLFNKPLEKYINQENLVNPWIYILDDDNVLHPRLLEIIKICQEKDYFGGKEIITTINKWHCGHNREIPDFLCLKEDKNGWISEYFLFDTSAVILRYNIIQKYGGYSSEFLYDFYWLNLPLIKEENEKNNIIWFADYDYSHGRHLVGSYHNGLVEQENIDKYNNIDTMNMDIVIYDTNVECPQMIPILSNESKEKIMQIINEEIQKYAK